MIVWYDAGPGAWCDCDEPRIIPAGVLAIWQDGTLHTPEACTVTDDLSLLSAGAR